MDEHADILLPILSWAWLAVVAAMVWLFKRVNSLGHDLQERRGAVNTAIAVLQSSQEELRKEVDKEAKRNSFEHQRIIDRIDQHHNSMMTRIDSLHKVVKNGH